jgi:hypothetical protein
MTDQLEFEELTIDRLANMKPVRGAYGRWVRVYESGNPKSPHVWLNSSGRSVQLAAANAWLLGRQLLWLVANHYQGDARPEDYEGYAREAMAVALLQTNQTVTVSSLANESPEKADLYRQNADELLEPLHRLGYAVIRVGPGEQEAEANNADH